MTGSTPFLQQWPNTSFGVGLGFGGFAVMMRAVSAHAPFGAAGFGALAEVLGGAMNVPQLLAFGGVGGGALGSEAAAAPPAKIARKQRAAGSGAHESDEDAEHSDTVDVSPAAVETLPASARPTEGVTVAAC